MADIRFNDKAKKNPYWFQIMVNGKRVTRRGFRTKGEARAALAEVTTELNKGTYIDPTKMTFGEYFRVWLDNRDNLAETTKDTYESYFKNHINVSSEDKNKKSICDIPISKLTALDIQNFVKELRGKNLSDGVVKGIFKTVNAALNTAEKMEIINKNVASQIEKPKVVVKERAIWKTESVNTVLVKARGYSRYWIAVFLAIMTGMRQGEILGLKWEDIDFTKKLIHVRRGLRKNTKEFTNLKTKSSKRVIAISDITIQVLMLHLELIEMEKLKAKDAYQDYGLVVCTQKGTPAGSGRINIMWQAICRKFKPAEEPYITFHDLRHQSASIMLNSGEDIRVVSQRLGHATISTTLNVYSHLLPNAQERAAQALDTLVASNVLAET